MIPKDQGGGGTQYHLVNKRKQVLRFAEDDNAGGLATCAWVAVR